MAKYKIFRGERGQKEIVDAIRLAAKLCADGYNVEEKEVAIK